MRPNLDGLIADIKERIQLDPWTATGELQNASLLTPILGIDRLAGVSDPGEFRWRDCEALLEQASALLDRALADRAAFQQAGEKFATFSSDVRRSIELIRISDEERRDQRFEVPYLISKSQHESLGESLNALNSESAIKSQAQARLSNEKDAQRNRPGYLEYLHLSDVTAPNAAHFQQPLGSYGAPAGSKARVDMANEIARDLASVELDLRELEMAAGVASVTGQAKALTKSLDGALVQLNWDDKNRQHLSARADLEKDLLAMKLAMAKVQWLLDFKAQMASIAPRYRQTLVDAYQRLRAVEAGLTNVYGRMMPSGGPSDPLPTLVDEPSVDSIIAWARRAGTWLAALARRTHNYVLPLSVKTLSAGGWESGKASGSWSFSVPETMFDQQCYIRTRGVAAWVVGGEPDALWTVDLRFPDSTTFLYADGTKTANQGVVRARLSAVTDRKSRLQPDVTGVVSCFNASPVGAGWTVKACDAFGRPGRKMPDDIHIDLYLAVVQK